MSVNFNPGFSTHAQYAVHNPQKASTFYEMVDQLERKYRYKMATLSPEKAERFAAVLEKCIASIKNNALDLPLDDKLREIFSKMLQRADDAFQNYFEQVEKLEIQADDLEVRYHNLTEEIATAQPRSEVRTVAAIFADDVPQEPLSSLLDKTRNAFTNMMQQRREKKCADWNRTKDALRFTADWAKSQWSDRLVAYNDKADQLCASYQQMRTNPEHRRVRNIEIENFCSDSSPALAREIPRAFPVLDQMKESLERYMEIWVQQCQQLLRHLDKRPSGCFPESNNYEYVLPF